MSSVLVWLMRSSFSQDDPLTCNNSLATCAQSGSHIGCCATSVESCTALPRACVESTESCGSACLSDPEILVCQDSDTPYCATFFFKSTAEFYGCYSTSGHTLQATYLSDYYSSVLGSDFTTYSDATITTVSHSTSSMSTTTSSVGASTAAGQIPESTGKSEAGGGGGRLSGGAIAGIVVGVVAVAACFAAFLVWVFFVKRHNNKGPSPPPTTQPVQQIPPNSGAPPLAGTQEPIYEQPSLPMPYNQYNPNASGYYSPTNSQYNQVFNPAMSPPQGSSDPSGYQAYNPGTPPPQSQSPFGQHPASPSTDYQSHSQRNSVHIPAGGPMISEMDGSNITPVSSASRPAQTEYQLSANNAGPTEPIYELSSDR